MSGRIEAVQKLLAEGADVEEKGGSTQCTPLQVAAGRFLKANAYPMVLLLLDNGASVLATTTAGKTPLHAVAEWEHAADGHQDIVRLLLQRGANVSAKTGDGETPLHAAAEKGHTEMVRLLLLEQADVSAKRDDGKTPLHAVASTGHEDILRLLLDAGADVSAQRDDGETPLHAGARAGSFRCFGGALVLCITLTSPLPRTSPGD